MERIQKRDPLMQKRVRRGASRGLAFLLAVAMVFSVTTTPVDAFSLGSFFKKVSNAISSTVKAVQRIVDTSDNKTVYSFSDLNSFTSSLFAPTNITVKLGKDIYVPSNRNISSVLHNVTMDLNGKTIYSDNPSQTLFISYGRKFTISNGTIVQRRNNSSGIIYMSGGDAEINNVTFKKSGSASRVTGLYTTGILADPKITFDSVTFDGMTTGLNIQYGARVVLKNSYIKNSQGDAVNIQGEYKNRKSSLDMTGGNIKYFKGNGINAGSGSKVNLTNVTVTGGTTRNRYGILAGKGSTVNLAGSTKVYSSAGGNIGVYKENPVNIASLGSTNKYSFTVVDGLDGTTAAPVANLSSAFSGDIRSLPAYSDISRYMVRGNEARNKIQIQDPPAQCNVTVQREWIVGKALDESKDANYATVSVNGGTEATSGSVAVKYDAKVTLSTTNNNPERYEFLGWYKYVDGASKVLISTNPTYQVEVFDENVTYKAEYRYMQYTITVKGSGKGSVAGGGTYYVDDTVRLTATPATVAGKTYAFTKWNDGNTESSRTITVSKNETYTGMFKKTGQTTGTMYLGVQEITSIDQLKKSGDKLLLIYVGSVGNSQGNKLEASSGNVGTTGLPDYSAKLTSNGTSDSHGRSAASVLAADEINGYGYGVNPKTTMLKVNVEQAGAGFDTCKDGYIERYTISRTGETCWLYWCGYGGVNAVGPFALYSYTDEMTFNMSDVKIEMPNTFRPSASGDTIDKDRLSVTVKVGNTTYALGGLKFIADDLDNQINYAEGDKLINFELDGVPVDYNFPEATINGQQYTKLSDAIAAATASENGETIKIVGPGVDSIDVTTPVALAVGDKIKGYDSETVTAVAESQIGVDKDGTVRLTQGTLEVDPSTASQAAIGVKDAFAKTDKKIQVTTTDGGKNSVITPEEEGTTLQISPDNNPQHLVTINGAGGDGKTYEFDNIPSYAGETVKIGKETEYTINIPGGETTSGSAIKTSKYNTGDTTIESGTGDGNPVITSTKEGDKVTVGDNTYVTGKNENDEPTKYQVNPDQSAEPSVVLEQGSLGIPKDTTIKVNDTIIKNTGSTDSDGNVTGENPVQISASGEIEIPDGAGVTIDGVEIQVPAKTPMNGNTTVTLDDDGKPTIKTTGDSEVKLVVDGKETTYQVGDYDCVLTIGDDGIPVIEDGEVRLQPGQTIKDRLGNEYKCPEDAEAPITIMTTPLVYETDDNGNQILGEDGKPILVGGGDMSFIIPEGKSIQCKPEGSNDYLTFENPGSESGFFNLDPARAADGIETDSEMWLAPGKELNLSAGEKSITVQAPESGNNGNILVDGSTGSVTLTNAGDKVIIGGKTYTAKEDNTVFIVDENGVTLSDGSTAAEQGAAVNAEGLSITEASGSNPMTISTGTDEAGIQSTTIHTSGKTEFAIAPVGKENAGINFATGSGEHSYPVGIDGSITLPKGETITRKSGLSQVEIKAPEDADITMKPLPKPGADEIKDGNGEITPVGGLLIEVPTGSAVTIGGKTYQETTIDNVRTGDDAYTLPMQLVLDEKGNVVLHNGTVELGRGADISLYDVGNELANFKNTSAGDQKVQITNPGIATMPVSGASITMGAGMNKVEFTTTEDETQIAYTQEICLLKRGGVELDPDEKILVSDMIVRNTSSRDKVKVTLDEQLQEDKFVYSGKIEVPNGSSFELSSPGSDKAIVYQSNVDGDGSAEFTINEDGNLVLPQDGIAKLTDSTGKETTVQAGVAGVESIPTSEGVMFAIPAGGHIVVNDVKYTNSADPADYLVLAVNQDGKAVLVKGAVELTEGAIVYVKNEDNGLVPIKNNAQSSSGEEPGAGESTVRVTYNGAEDQTDENGQVVGTTYSDVDIQVPDGGSISIGENAYDEAGSDGLGAKISMNIESGFGSTVADGNISGDRILLEEGIVDLGEDSSIKIKVSGNGSTEVEKVLTNISEDVGSSVLVGSDGKVELSTGSAVSVDDDTTIQVPAEGTDDYKAAVDLSKTDGTVNVELRTEDGTGTTGADKKVIINDDTYVSKEEDKNLSLQLDTTKDEVKLSGGSTSVGLSDGASIVIGDTTVTAKTDTELTVTETTASGSSTKVPIVDIPAGGEANFKNPNKNQDIDVKVPEKTGESDPGADEQKFTVDTEGNVSTNLKKDETVVIGGVEYTGTSESETDNKIKVDGTTGELLDKPQDAPPIVSIDPEQFDKPNYQYTITEGQSVSVNGVVYQAATGSAIILMGNPSGNPIVKLANADSSAIIGGTTYTAANADTRFVLDEKGKITLKDNGSADPDVNSSLKLSGEDARTVNGVTYSGSTEEDAYTVTYHADGSYVKVADGSKLLMNMPAGAKIYVADKGAIETKDENGDAVTETFAGPVPVTMNGGSGIVYLDKTREDSTDTAFVQILGLKDVDVQYENIDEGNKTIKAIVITQKRNDPVSGTGETETKDDQKINSIPVTGDTEASKVEVAVAVEENKIIVDTITTDVVEKLINTEAEGTKVVALDCSALEKPTVVLDVPTVENMAEKVDQIRIITASADIVIDKQATDAILQQATGDTIEIKVNFEEKTILNEVQKEALKNYEVKTCLDAFVESNGIRIHDFKGGKVTVSIPWDVEAGKKSVYYHVYYLDEEGVMHVYETVYSDGKLCFETEHFSEYVVVYDDGFLNATPVDQTPVLARVTKVGKTSLKLKWKQVEGAKKYVIYAAKCNTPFKKYKLKKVATVGSSKSVYAMKNLKTGTNYKIVVKALGDEKAQKKSLVLHVITKGGNYNNASGISLLTKSIVLKTGKTKVLKAKYNYDLKSVKHDGMVRYVSSNEEVATVSKAGKIQAKRAGTCYVYAILSSGEYATVKVTVK